MRKLGRQYESKAVNLVSKSKCYSLSKIRASLAGHSN